MWWFYAGMVGASLIAGFALGYTYRDKKAAAEMLDLTLSLMTEAAKSLRH